MELSRRTRFLIGIALPWIALAVQWLVWPYTQPFAWFLFFPAVFFSAWIGGRRAGLIATFESAALVWFFFLPPQLSLRLSNPHNIWSVLVFVITGLLVADSQGRLERALAKANIARDESESRLRDQAELLEATSRIARIGGWELDVATGAGRWSDEIARIHDLDPAVSPNVKLGLAYYTNESRPIIERAVAEAIQKGTPYDLELQIVSDAGVHKWIRTTGHPELENGKVVRLTGTMQDVSERKRAELARMATEARFQRLFGALLEGVAHCEIVVDDAGRATDWRYLDVNPAFARITGLHDVTGRLATEAIPGIMESNPELLDYYGGVAKTGEPREFEVYVPVLPRGRWLHVSATRPGPGQFVAVFNDITERKTAEDALQSSEARYRQLVEQTPDGIFVADAAGHYIDVNAAGAAMMGYTREQLLGLTFVDVLDPSELGRLAPEIEAMAHGERRTTEWVFRREDGSTFIGELVGVMLPDGRLQGILRDVTQRKEAEQAIAESEARYRALFDTLREGVAYCEMVLGEDGRAVDWRYLSVNPAYGVVTGLAGVEGKLASEVIPEVLGSNPRLLSNLSAVALDGEPREFDVFLEHLPAGPRWLHTSATSPSKGRFVVALTDITQRVMAQDEIRELNATLERRVEQRTAEVSAVNKELESFSYAVSHDLRAPLRAMSGFSQALIDDYGASLDETARDYLDHIISASRKMGALIDALLTLSRATRGELIRSRVDISAMATAILAEKTAQQPERDVAWSVQPGLTLDGDPRMLEVALTNLLGNAWKYTSRTRGATITVTGCDTEGTTCLRIADNGAGFDPQYAAQLFVPFQRLHKQEEFAGIGIGLATVLRIVERHGGTIQAEGAPGQGATFTLRLPAS